MKINALPVEVRDLIIKHKLPDLEEAASAFVRFQFTFPGWHPELAETRKAWFQTHSQLREVYIACKAVRYGWRPGQSYNVSALEAGLKARVWEAKQA